MYLSIVNFSGHENKRLLLLLLLLLDWLAFFKVYFAVSAKDFAVSAKDFERLSLLR